MCQMNYIKEVFRTVIACVKVDVDKELVTSLNQAEPRETKVVDIMTSCFGNDSRRYMLSC